MTDVMNSDQYLWNQIAEIHEFLRFTGGQGMTWFAFGVGANTAAAWAIFGGEVRLNLRIVPAILGLANLFAVAMCWFWLPWYYRTASESLARLAEHMEAVGRISAGTDRTFILNPAFDPTLWIAICRLMALLFAVISVGWLYVAAADLLRKRQAGLDAVASSRAEA
jgi:hypothetical protein